MNLSGGSIAALRNLLLVDAITIYGITVIVVTKVIPVDFIRIFVEQVVHEIYEAEQTAIIHCNRILCHFRPLNFPVIGNRDVLGMYLALDNFEESERYASMLLDINPYYMSTMDPIRFEDMVNLLK